MDAKCLRCEHKMRFLKQYKFDSQDNNRGLLSSIFDVEERLIFDVYVCPKCKHTEFFHKGTDQGLDYD